MDRILARLWMAALLVSAPAFARDEKKDALLGSGIPAAAAWRASPRNQPTPQTGAAASLEILKTARAELQAAPAGKPQADLIAALIDLENDAARLPPEKRQDWIDGHLGTFNETLRALDGDAPGTLIRKAAKAAAKLNGRAERWNDAREFAEQALSYDPDDRDALISRSRANAGLGDSARAYADADRATRLSPASADAYTARAAAAYGFGNYSQAIEDSRRALLLDAGNKTAFTLMKLSEGRAKKIPDFDRTESSTLAGSIEGEYHGMLQQLSQAAERRLAPIEEPGIPLATRLASSAGAKIAVKDYWGAVDDADKALALDATDWRALYFRAAAHNLIGEYGEAARDATRGLAIKPSDPALHDARAWAYNRMGRFADAIADAHWALESDPRDPYAFANRAYANERRGDYDAMLADYKAAAALNLKFEPMYIDAARRHGLMPPADDRDAAPARRREKQLRSFAAVVLSSLCGGLLIALGLLHVNARVEDLRAARTAKGLEAEYALGKPIGQGGMGLVYEAFDRKLRRPVAIKMLRGEWKLDGDAKTLLLEEARTVAELRHPAIVDIHNIVEDDRGVYLVFERLEGRTLDQVLAEKKRLPLAEIKRVLKPVCDALEYAHARGVVHRDLKPSNIMLTADGVKVLDFGISRHDARADSTAATQTPAGTPEYMAPEQEQGVVRKENDLFSLGAVLREMAAGVQPGSGPRASAPRPELDALIARCLEPDPEKRLRSPAEFWDALATIPDYGV